jgi:hypothetical protein
MARKALKKAVSARLNDADYQEILTYSEASEIAMADLLRIGAKEYINNHPLRKTAPVLPGQTQLVN